MRKTLLQLASDVLEIAPGDLFVREGRIRSLDGAIDVPVAEITEKLGDATIDGSGSRGPNPAGFEVHTFGCQIAQVVVDPAVGEIRVERVVAVHDVGRIVNRLGAASQVEGGVLQGMAFALMEELVVDPTTGVPVNATLDDYKLPTIADTPEIVVDFVDVPDENLPNIGAKARRASDHPHRGRDRERVRPRDRPPLRRAADDARAGTRGAPVSGYARPPRSARRWSCSPSLRAPLGGGTDVAGQVDRGIRRPALLVDLCGQRGSTSSVRTVKASSWARGSHSPISRPRRCWRRIAPSAAAAHAASPLLRNVGTVGGNLCQHTRCWYYRGLEWHCWLGGGDTCYAQIGDHRKHGLEPGDCISAHPSDLAPALAACGATVSVRSRDGERQLPLLELYRRPPTTAPPGRSQPGRSSPRRLPGPPQASA